MRISNFLLGFIAIGLLSFTAPGKQAAGHHGPWKFIADKWVNFGVDRDVIHLSDIRDDFRQLKIKVTDGPLKMLDMKIYFDNGSVQDVQLRSLFRQGSESRVIDLDGGLRHLSKIEFWYETVGRAKGKARVAVWGKK
jgi:hypothetical protein